MYKSKFSKFFFNPPPPCRRTARIRILFIRRRRTYASFLLVIAVVIRLSRARSLPVRPCQRHTRTAIYRSLPRARTHTRNSNVLTRALSVCHVYSVHLSVPIYYSCVTHTHKYRVRMIYIRTACTAANDLSQSFRVHARARARLWAAARRRPGYRAREFQAFVPSLPVTQRSPPYTPHPARW